MKFRIFAFVFVSVVAPFVFGETVTPFKDAPLFPTRNNFFTIPFEIKVNDSSELPTEVELTYSTDHGMNWFPYGRVQPDKKQFLFKSPSDGEYWFIFKTYGQDGLVKETRRRGPMLRVLVDTTPPKLSLTSEQKSTGEIVIQWSVEDANLARKSPQLQISYSIPDQKSSYLSNWKPVAIDPLKVQSEENKHRGELVIWPERDAVSFEIQAEISDAAGNREMQSRTVLLAVTEKADDANVLTESMLSKRNHSMETEPKTADSLVSALTSVTPKQNTDKAVISADVKQATVSLTPPRPLVISQTASGQAKPQIPSQIPDLAAINKAIKEKNANKPTNSAVASPILDFNLTLPPSNETGKDSVVIGPLLFPEDAVKTAGDSETFVVGSPQEPISPANKIGSETPGNSFELSLEEPDTSFGTEDEAVTGVEDGPKLSIPNPKNDWTNDILPPVFEETQNDDPVKREEIPNETTQATEEQTEQTEQVETSAEETAVDTAAFIRITKVSHLRGLKLSQIVVKWEADETSWTGKDDVKIHVFRGPSQQGPWTPIAMDQKNEGSYAWIVSQEDRDPFYVLLQCERGGESKNVVSDLTMQPIQLPAALFEK